MPAENKSQRIEWINQAKGLGMLCVVYGHVVTRGSEVDLIYTFHVPLFFFLAGVVFRPGKYNSIGALIQHRFWALLIPYLVIGFLSLAYGKLLILLTIHSPTSTSPWPVLSGFITGTRGQHSFNSSLWFLPCLFSVECISFLHARHLKPALARIASIAVLATVSIIYSAKLAKPAPFCLDIAPIALVFHQLGILYKKEEDTIEGLENRRWYAVTILFVFCLCYYLQPVRVDMYRSCFGSPPVYFLGALSGTLGIILFLKKTGPVPFLSLIGVNSLGILVFHQWLSIGAIRSMLQILPMPSSHLAAHLSAILNTGLVLTMTLVICILLRRNFPLILGGKKT